MNRLLGLVAGLLLAFSASAQISSGSTLAIGGTCTGCTAGSILYVGAGPVLAQDNTNFNYTTASGPRLQVGSGSTTSAGLILGYRGASGYSALWSTAVTPDANNWLLSSDSQGVYLNSPLATVGGGGMYFSFANAGTRMSLSGVAGQGLAINPGTAATAVSALTITQTWNYNAAALDGVLWTFTDTSSHASTNVFKILCGAAGTTNCLSVSKAGNIATTGQVSAGSFAITSLPTGIAGAIAVVTDQAAACPAKGVAPTAGGALVCPVFYTGAAWVGI